MEEMSDGKLIGELSVKIVEFVNRFPEHEDSNKDIALSSLSLALVSLARAKGVSKNRLIGNFMAFANITYEVELLKENK